MIQMSSDEIPKLEIIINGNMTNEEYIRWNIAGASRRLRDAPQETELTLMIYNVHKIILRARGVTEPEFYEGNKIIDEIVKQYHYSN